MKWILKKWGGTISNNRNAEGCISKNPTVIKIITAEYHQQIYFNKFEHVYEMVKFVGSASYQND